MIGLLIRGYRCFVNKLRGRWCDLRLLDLWLNLWLRLIEDVVIGEVLRLKESIELRLVEFTLLC